MEQLNSGDSYLELWDVQQGWVSFLDAYLTEATEYKLRYMGDYVDVRIQNMPWPFYQQDNCFYASFITPFQSGEMDIIINDKTYQTFIYPDNRKLTQAQYNQMIEEILDESNSCFQLSGLTMNVNSSGRNRNITWTQWSYIEQTFYQLQQIFGRIYNQPIRRLTKLPIMLKREKVQRAEHVTLQWLDKKGYGEDIPKNIETVKTFETTDVYENQVLKQQVNELYRLLREYETVEEVEISRKAKKYKSIILRWINGPFIKEITINKGSYTITQTFRKHPIYRLWYQWFDNLYKHSREGIGFAYPISLKNTFDLYEMWCYLRIVKVLREAGFVSDTSQLFRQTKEGMFLNLAENKESRIGLHGGISLYFQRSYQYNTKVFHTYTQKMIPDIVLEGKKGIIVFDPKYRVPTNLGTALGEMHKYRDGIIHRETEEKAVKEVYILTPTKIDQAETMRYFQDYFHEKYKMGAIQLGPGGISEDFTNKILSSVKSLWS